MVLRETLSIAVVKGWMIGRLSNNRAFRRFADRMDGTIQNRRKCMHNIGKNGRVFTFVDGWIISRLSKKRTFLIAAKLCLSDSKVFPVFVETTKLSPQNLPMKGIANGFIGQLRRYSSKKKSAMIPPPPAQISSEDNWVKVQDKASGQSYWWNTITNATTALRAPKPSSDFPPTVENFSFKLGSVTDCTPLKHALLSAEVEKGFLTLPNSNVFPVSLKEATNLAPSKLLLRSFHGELSLILSKLRSERKLLGNNGGAIFYGPSGTGKSWAAQAVLLQELKTAEKNGNAVVYFDATGKKAFIFSQRRNLMISAIASPNEIEIPELKDRSTVLIYDAVRGSQDPLTSFPCEFLIFSSPNAGNFRQVARNNGLVCFVCPNWTLDELKMLEHAYGDRYCPEEVENLFERFGGSPRAVIANASSISATQRRDAMTLLNGVYLWSDLTAMSSLWPSSLLKAKYQSEKIAVTPEEAHNKYLEENVNWEYSNSRAMNLVHEKYDQAEEATRRTFQSWLECESKASALYGYWFEHKTRSLFLHATAKDVEVKSLDEKREKQAGRINRESLWKLPKFKVIEDANILKDGKAFNLTSLKKLTDHTVLYRLPVGFPLIDYYNPPNNCFSLGVGNHTIHLKHALELCKTVIPERYHVNFIFVTPSNNYNRVTRSQSFQTSPEEQKIFDKLPDETRQTLSRFFQYCMRFKTC